MLQQKEWDREQQTPGPGRESKPEGNARPAPIAIITIVLKNAIQSPRVLTTPALLDEWSPKVLSLVPGVQCCVATPPLQPDIVSRSPPHLSPSHPKHLPVNSRSSPLSAPCHPPGICTSRSRSLHLTVISASSSAHLCTISWSSLYHHRPFCIVSQ